MKVLICHERYEPDFGGGGEIVVHQTALHLARLGIDVRVVTTGDPAIRSVDGIPTRRLPVSRYRFNLASRAVTEMAHSVDIIQTFNYHACLPALAAGRNTGKPVVCGVLGLFSDEWISMRGAVVGRMFQAWESYLLCKPYSRVFFLSEFSRQAGIKLGVDPQRTTIASPGVDTRAFRPANRKNDVVLFAGKIDPRKGIDDLVKVANALPEVQFQIVCWGSHPCASALYAMSNVEIISFDRNAEPETLDNKDLLIQAFSRARIFFFPSRAETYGMVLVEAMASGCAIVSTIDLDYEGIKVRPHDVDAMIQAIRDLWNDRDRTALMGNINVERAKNITWEHYADTLRDTYLELIAADT
jgi:glycosyltransferase involved in cell wall biosynthesis